MMNCNFKCKNCISGNHDLCEDPLQCHVTYGGVENN